MMFNNGLAQLSKVWYATPGSPPGPYDQDDDPNTEPTPEELAEDEYRLY